MAKKTAKRAASRGDGAADARIERVELSKLLLDPDNPRLGLRAGTVKDQTELLDLIVSMFGIEDVLSSIAVNGYFQSEPLIGVRTRDGKIKIVEGNRRLAACLILAGDPRAANQSARAERGRALLNEHGKQSPDTIPVAVFDASEVKEFVPYLGVRHIAGAQEWDSYAKARWVAEAVRDRGISIDAVANMIGDNQRLARRMLAGYYVTEQLIDEGLFHPEQSRFSGRGSRTDFPFSWVYTALGNTALREWLNLSEEPQEKPLSREGKKRGEELFTWMFGQDKRDPASEESREIGDLARAIVDPEQQAYLRKGLTVRECKRRTRPAETQIADALSTARESLEAALTPLVESGIGMDEAVSLQTLSSKVLNLAQDVRRRIVSAMTGETAATGAGE